ncbi:MFS transporter [Consotaella aegiceratis]|uniref:MFS transporter n=1 Tax=Consotaella aegiceratis TaxID=3097961 RepID=UPI002F4096D1
MSNALSSSAIPARKVWPLVVKTPILMTFFGGATVPTPLYPIYRADWQLSSLAITLVFAVYAMTLLAALLIAGSLSDHVGRRPVIFAALLIQSVAMVAFIDARGFAMLFAARAVQGVATGLATSALGAALVDVDRHAGPLINSLAPLGGMAIGVAGAAALVDYAPEPMRLVYVVLLCLCLIEAVLIWLVPEAAHRRSGALMALIPRIRVPASARYALLALTPLNVATWMTGGFFMSLMPSIIKASLEADGAMVGGMVVAGLMLSGTLAVFMLRRFEPHAVLRLGGATMMLGLVLLVLGINLGNLAVLFGGTAATGIGLGCNFLGCVRSIMPLAAPSERAELLAAYYVESYLAMSLPAVAAGTLAGFVGLPATADIYGVVIFGLLVIGALAARRLAPQPVLARQ